MEDRTMDKRLIELSTRLDGLIEFQALEALLAKLGAKAGKGYAKTSSLMRQSASEVGPGLLKPAAGIVKPAIPAPKWDMLPPVHAGAPVSSVPGGALPPAGADKLQLVQSKALPSETPGSPSTTTQPQTQAGAAQQDANAAAAGQNPNMTSRLKKWGLTTGIGVGAGAAVAIPDWALKQNNTQSMNALLDHLILFADPRPRNSLGEFSGQEGGPDANAMATTYKMPQAQPQGGGGLGVTKAGGAVLAGGALGAIGSGAGKAGWAGITKLVKHLASKSKSKIVKP